MTDGNLRRISKDTTAVTVAKLEERLDKLAYVMSRSKEASIYLPLWKRLEHELALRRDVEEVLEAANSRVKLLQNRSVSESQ